MEGLLLGIVGQCQTNPWPDRTDLDAGMPMAEGRKLSKWSFYHVYISKQAKTRE